MSRSEVVVCLKTALCAEMTPEQRKLWFEDADSHHTDPAGEAWKWKEVKWYRTYPEVQALYDWLWDHEEADYLVLVATAEAPEDDSADYGSWSENPWKAYKWVNCGVSLEGDE